MKYAVTSNHHVKCMYKGGHVHKMHHHSSGVYCRSKDEYLRVIYIHIFLVKAQNSCQTYVRNQIVNPC